MTPVATYRENATDYQPTLERENGVYRGVKFFHIAGAANIADTYQAVGLPAQGDPYDATTPQCRASRYTPERLAGAGGFWKMRVEFVEPGGGGGGVVIPEPGLVVSTFVSQYRSSENVNRNIENTRDLTSDGTGVPKLVNAMTIVITTYSDQVPLLAPLIELSDSPKVNSQDLVLPNLLGSDQTLTVPAGQLLYAGFTPSYEGGLFVVRHELLWSRQWTAMRYPTGPDGVVDGPPEVLNVYEAADFVAVIGG